MRSEWRVASCQGGCAWAAGLARSQAQIGCSRHFVRLIRRGSATHSRERRVPEPAVDQPHVSAGCFAATYGGEAVRKFWSRRAGIESAKLRKIAISIPAIT